MSNNLENLETILEYCELDSKQKKKLLKLVSKYEEPVSVLYDAIGRIQEEPFETVYRDLKKNNLGYNSSNYNTFKEKREAEDQILENPPEIKENTVECPKCKTKKTIIQEIQTRSCDEGFTYKLHCYNPKCKFVKIM